MSHDEGVTPGCSIVNSIASQPTASPQLGAMYAEQTCDGRIKSSLAAWCAPHHHTIPDQDVGPVVCTCHQSASCSAPAGYFLTKIFHPNVSKAGEICVNVLKRDWKADLGLRHILVIIRSARQD